MVLSLARTDPREGVRPGGAPNTYRVILDDDRRRNFLRNVLDRAPEEPGVGVFALATRLPMGSGPRWAVRATSDRSESGFEGLVAEVSVSERYFEATGMRILAGRSFEVGDGAYGDSRDRVIVLSATVAKAFGGAHAAIGQYLQWAVNGYKPTMYRVVGVVSDVDPVLEDGHQRPAVVYRFIRQDGSLGSSGYALTRSADPRAAGAVARRLIGRVDPFEVVASMHTLSDMQAEVLYPRRLGAAILVIAASVGLLLAAIGVYGVIAYTAAQRRREMGIRSTLGAGRLDIVALVLREGVVIVGIGTSAGLALAVWVVRATASLIAGMPRIDVLAFTIVPALLALVVLAASLLPALRASRVDPAVVLRGE
jgi:hypothetical protein